MRYCLDSNVIIDLIGNKIPLRSGRAIANAIDGSYCVASAVVRMEVLGFHRANSEEIERAVALLNLIELVEIEKPIQNITIQLRRKYPKLKLPDAIIAATSQFKNYPVITHNVKDFEIVGEIRVLNSFEFRG